MGVVVVSVCRMLGCAISILRSTHVVRPKYVRFLTLVRVDVMILWGGKWSVFTRACGGRPEKETPDAAYVPCGFWTTPSQCCRLC